MFHKVNLRVLRRAIAVCGFSLVAASAPARAGDLPKQPSSLNARSNQQDLHLTVQARQALSKDPIVGRYNICVTVQARRAVLTGAVPSEAVARRMEDQVRKIVGIITVERMLRIDPSIDDALGQAGKQTMPQALVPAAPPTYDPAPRKLQDQPGFLGITGSAPASRPLLLTSPIGADPDAASPRPPVTAALTPAKGPTATLLSPVLVDTGDSGLKTAVDRLSRGTERFRRLRVEVRGDTVWLQGAVWQSADLFALAEGVSRIPGVERVVVDNTGRVESSRP